MTVITKLEKIIKQYQLPYTITRGSNQSADEGGRPIEIGQTFETMMFVNTSEKEKKEFYGTGLDSQDTVKIRILKEYLPLEEDDTFLFLGDKYRVMKPKRYQENVLNFRSFYAVIVK